MSSSLVDASKIHQAALSNSAQSSAGKLQGVAQKHRGSKRLSAAKLAANSRAHSASNAINSTTKPHKYKVVRVIKRKKKPSIVDPIKAHEHSASASSAAASSSALHYDARPPVAPKPAAFGAAHSKHAETVASAPSSRSSAIAPETVKPSQTMAPFPGNQQTPTADQRAAAAVDARPAVSGAVSSAAPVPELTTRAPTMPALPVNSIIGTDATTPNDNLIHLDSSKQPQSLSVSHNVLLSQPNSRIINKADSSGLVSTSRDNGDIKPPLISKDVIEWLAHERLNKNQINIDLHKEIESQRYELMLQRQFSAARQIRLANRLNRILIRDTIDQDQSEQLLDSDVSVFGLPTPFCNF